MLAAARTWFHAVHVDRYACHWTAASATDNPGRINGFEVVVERHVEHHRDDRRENSDNRACQNPGATRLAELNHGHDPDNQREGRRTEVRQQERRIRSSPRR